MGLLGGAGGVLAASKRYATIRHLTLPMKSFLVTSSGTFLGIISADNASRAYEKQQNADQRWYESREKYLHEQETKGMSFMDRTVALARQEKYKIIGVTWIASMVGSFMLVGRNPFLSGSQKIVQARVYAQGLTLAVLVASAAFEISDQKKGKGIMNADKSGAQKKATTKDEKINEEQGDLWKDMVAAEEERLKKRHQPLYEHHNGNGEQAEQAEQGEKGEKKPEQGEKKDDQKAEKKDDKKTEQKDEKKQK